jgi:FkbM family methyltransferase
MYLNKCNNVRMFHKALGANQRWAAMHIPKEHWHAWYAPNLVNEGHGTISLDLEQCKGDRVQIVKLDDFHLENVSFIKMDVEGFEMEVVAGGLETIQKNKPIMIIEIFNNPQRHTKIQTIEDLGYASSNLSGDDYLFIPLEQLGLTK